MPPKRNSNRRPTCTHDCLITDPSQHAFQVGYKQFTAQQLFTAATGSRKGVPAEYATYASSCPSPLVLPGDELAHDPRCPPQSFKSWLNGEYRNEITSSRQTVYVAAPPKLTDSALFMRDWVEARQLACEKWQNPILPPSPEDVVEYLQAFFYDLPVKLLPDQLLFSQHTAIGKPSRNASKSQSASSSDGLPKFIEVQSTSTGIATRIRVRHLTDHEQYSPYLHQMNLNDLLDHAIAVLPEDAYCLLLMVDYDLYEDESDDFCCGRAYGGSRICVVSSAQYQPVLDSWHDIDVKAGHGWPGSHCKAFVDLACGVDVRSAPAATQSNKSQHSQLAEETSGTTISSGTCKAASDAIVLDSSAMPADSTGLMTPLKKAVAMHRRMQRKKKFSRTDLDVLYLHRVALTATHELLHCFGFDHCVYFACAMQGTASMQEDHRQPPYLCPVCENKLARAICYVQDRKPHATDTSSDWWTAKDIVDWKIKRDEAIFSFCKSREADDVGFASLLAWTKARLNKVGR